MNHVKVSVKTVCLLIPLLLSLLLYPSCQLTTSSTSQDKFTLIEHKNPGIQNPELAWTYHQPEHDIHLMSLRNSPLIDQYGNLYFVDHKGTLKSIDANGQLRWEREGFTASRNNIAICKEGIITSVRSKVSLIDTFGKLIWEKDLSFNINGIFLSSDGSLIINTYEKFLALDVKGSIKWVLIIGEESFFTGIYFFDVESNGYFFHITNDEETYIKDENCYAYDTYLISISPEGKFRWKKLLTKDRNLIDSFVPANHRIKDTFLLGYHQGTEVTNDPSSVKIIAYDTDGNEQWHFFDERRGSIYHGYAHAQNNNFYVPFNTDEESQDYIRCLSFNGKELWCKVLEGRVTGGPSLDDDNNLYVGLKFNKDSYLYAFDDMGNEQWNLRIDSCTGLAHSPLLDPFKGIYLTANARVLFFYITEKKQMNTPRQ